MAHVQREVEPTYAADRAFEMPTLTEALPGDGRGSSASTGRGGSRRREERCSPDWTRTNNPAI